MSQDILKISVEDLGCLSIDTIYSLSKEAMQKDNANHADLPPGADTEVLKHFKSTSDGQDTSAREPISTRAFQYLDRILNLPNKIQGDKP